MSASRTCAALADHESEEARSGPAILPASCKPKRCDTLIASAVLALLIAGWVLNFVSVKQLSIGLGDLIAHASSRQA